MSVSAIPGTGALELAHENPARVHALTAPPLNVEIAGNGAQSLRQEDSFAVEAPPGAIDAGGARPTPSRIEPKAAAETAPENPRLIDSLAAPPLSVENLPSDQSAHAAAEVDFNARAQLSPRPSDLSVIGTPSDAVDARKASLAPSKLGTKATAEREVPRNDAPIAAKELTYRPHLGLKIIISVGLLLAALAAAKTWYLTLPLAAIAAGLGYHSLSGGIIPSGDSAPPALPVKADAIASEHPVSDEAAETSAGLIITQLKSQGFDPALMPREKVERFLHDLDGAPSADDLRRILARIDNMPPEINRTSFFRDARVWRKIRLDLESLIKRRISMGRRSLVMKSLGSAEGQEAYSLAFLVQDILYVLGEDSNEWDIRIEVYDFNPSNLLVASLGLYRFIPRAWRGYFDVLPNGWYQARKPLRDWITPIRIDIGDRSQWKRIARTAGQVLLYRYVHPYFSKEFQRAMIAFLKSGTWSEGNEALLVYTRWGLGFLPFDESINVMSSPVRHTDRPGP